MKVEARDTFGRDRLAVGAGAEHKVANFVAEDGLLLLIRVERIDERERLVVLVAQRTDRPAIDAVAGRLRARVRRRQHVLAPRERDVDGEMMAAKLNHPRIGRGRLAEDADVVLGAAEADRELPGARRGAPRLEHLVGVDDRHHLLEAVAAQRRGDQRKRRLLLRGRHVAELEAVPLGGARLQRDARRQVRPDGAGLLVERDVGLEALALVERGQERLGGGHGAGGGVRGRGRALLR